MYQFQLSISLPLYYRQKQRAALTEQVNMLAESRRMYEAANQDLHFRIQDQFLLVQASWKLLQLYSSTTVPEASLAFESSLSSYKAGTVDFLSVLTNYMSVFDYEVNYYEEVQICFGVMLLRERLIAKLAVIAGMRRGEIFAFTWGRLTAAYADIRQRVYRGLIDTPKTEHSVRQAALSEGLLAEIEVWRMAAVDTRDDAWVFPSERMTPLSKDNCWRRCMQPALAKVGLGWANFLVMRRMHSTLMKQLKVDSKLVADQLGHSSMSTRTSTLKPLSKSGRKQSISQRSRCR